jgi:hypothetical protein
MMRTLIALMIVLSGCGPSPGDLPFVRTERCTVDCPPEDAGAVLDAGPPEIPDEPLEEWDLTDADPLTGIFAMEVAINVEVVIAQLVAKQYYRVRLHQVGEEIRYRSQLCRLELPSVAGVAEIMVPPPLEAVIRERDSEGQGPHLSPAEPLAGATLDLPLIYAVLGAELADPLSDPLPSTEAPASAVDDDGDGHPGVSLDIDAVLCASVEQAYTALRVGIDPVGVVVDEDRIEGSIMPMLEWSFLGFSSACLGIAASLEVEVLPGSSFRMVRVDDVPEYDLDENGNVSCPEIAWLAPAIFAE